MNKKILLSVLTIGAVLTVVGAGTWAQFTDQESANGNTFSAGTIDIAVDGKNPWTQTSPYALTDMKPSYTDYINFTIKNVGSNPANVWKKLWKVVTADGVQSEPECVEQGGKWDSAATPKCTYDPASPSKDGIDNVIEYDLYVELYDSDSAPKWSWHQMLYDKDVTINQIADKDMYLGMIPVGWSMKVYQSYHMKDSTTNWAQGDTMTFDIALRAEQLLGGPLGASVTLEDKSGESDWDINQTSAPTGTFNYTVMSPKFDFSFSGVAPKASTEYSLIFYPESWSTPSGSGWPRPVTVLATATSDGSGVISIPSTSVDLGNINVKNMKVWLVKSADISGGSLSTWAPADYLFETGLIDYRDTDL